MSKAGKSKNWGGKRPGSGRKKVPKTAPEYSDEFKGKLFKEMFSIAEETGKSFQRILLETAYGMLSGVHPTAITSAQKLICDINVVRESKQTIEQKAGPTIFLPQVAERPPEFRNPENEIETRRPPGAVIN